MADKKITQFTEITTPANDDLLVIVDVSDGTTKKIQKSNLVPTKTSDLTNDVPFLEVPSTNATLPLAPTNTLIVEQGGAYKKVAVSEVGGKANEHYIYAPANRKFLNQTTIQPIFSSPNNSFSFLANKLYEFEGFITTFFDSTTYIDFGMLGDFASCIDVNYAFFASTNLGNPYVIASESQTFESTRIFGIYNGFRNSRMCIKGSFKTNANGTIIPSIGFDTVSQGLNIRKGSFMKFKEIIL